MRKDLSAIEMAMLVKEMNFLEKSRVSKIIQQDKKELIFELYVPTKGKFFLRFLSPNFFYFSKNNVAKSEVLHFGSVLRSHLSNAVLLEILQPNFERILTLKFASKKGNYNLIFEMFSKGNIVLTDENNVVIQAAQAQRFSSRNIKSKELYAYPPAKVDARSISKSDFTKLMADSTRESLVKALAIDLGIGGIFAEELVMRCNLDKDVKPDSVSAADAAKLYKQISSFFDAKLEPKVYFEGDKLIDFSPYDLQYFSGLKSQNMPAFSDCVEGYFKDFNPKATAGSRNIRKYELMVESQESTIKQLEESISQSTKIGQAMYENYALINGILSDYKKTKSKSELFKKYPCIKKFDEKNAQLVIEI